MSTNQPRIYLGLDVGKTDHWACALTDSGQVLWNKTLPNNEQKLTDIYTNLSAKGSVLVVVDQPATIGALAIAPEHARKTRGRRRSWTSRCARWQRARPGINICRSSGRRHSPGQIRPRR